MNNKNFNYKNDGIQVAVSYWSKDFTIKYNSPKYGLFEYSRHLMYTIPRAFTQKDVEKAADYAISLFKAAETWLDNHTDALEQNSNPENFKEQLLQKLEREKK